MSPPDDARAMMRWWWFGPSVSLPELEREIRTMKNGGIGGFEIQPVYPLELDDPGKGFRNFAYLSDEFLEAVRFANRKGKELGMRVDITLGSGWPFGGPHIPVTEAAGKLRMVTVAAPAGIDSVALPSVANGESLIAAFLAPGEPSHFDAAHTQPLTLADKGDLRLRLRPDPSARTVLFFLASRTGQKVKRPAVGAEGFVLDHFDRSAIERHLRAVGDRLMTAFENDPPYAVFSDSLESYESDWTPDLPQEFRARRGYDLVPHLPALFADAGPDTPAIRHDWGQTLAELVDEHYLMPITAWAAQHHTLFRSQTYGDPAVTLSSNRLVDLPEGEGWHWRGFSTTRWASSANHLYGRKVTSAETWTWLHSPAFRATPLDMKAEADLFFLQGVNQIVGHGWPYSPDWAGSPGWAFYAAGAFNDHNPWWPVMPELMRYLQRVSYLLRQGEPVDDVAIFLPVDDAWANFAPGRVSVSERMKDYVTQALTEQILGAGLNFDYIDAAAIEQRGIPYAVLILPGVDRIPLATYRKIEEYAKNGGKVIVVGSSPAHAPGRVEPEDSSRLIRQISERLFQSQSPSGAVALSAEAIGPLLAKACPPDMRVEGPAPEIGFVHRRLAAADVFFLANTSNHPVQTTATFRSPYTHFEWWDPMTSATISTGNGKVSIELAPYESQVLVLEPESATARPQTPPETGNRVLLDLSHDWSATFTGIGYSTRMASLRSWTDDPMTRFYSGEAVYEREFVMPDTTRPPAAAVLDFGEGSPVARAQDGKLGMRAWLESPVREAAVIYVNGKRAGAVWHPPYQMDVGALLRPGKNRIEVRVANLAINTLAGRTLPDYRLLNSRYGQRFQAQDVENLAPVPAGILGTVTLRIGTGAR